MARRELPAIHPGEHLWEEMVELGLSARALASALDTPVSRIMPILRAQRAVTADTALRLGRYFGTSAEFWLNLQKIYELRRAEALAGDAIRRSVKPRAA